MSLLIQANLNNVPDVNNSLYVFGSAAYFHLTLMPYAAGDQSLPAAIACT